MEEFSPFSGPNARKKQSGPGTALLNAQEFDPIAAVGGVRAIAEAVIPTLVFLVLFIILKDHILPACISLAVCLLFAVLRLIKKITVLPAVGGILAMALSVFIVRKTGNSSDFFVIGLATNAIYAGGILLSILLRRPLPGIVLGYFRGEKMQWVKGENMARTRLCYYSIAWIWFAVFGSRLIVQMPLYLADSTEILGLAKLFMGLPVTMLALYFSWMLLRRLPGKTRANDAGQISG